MKTLADIFGVKIEKDMVKKRPMRVEDIDCSSRLEKYFKEHNSKVKHGNNKMREEFEKLPEIAQLIEEGKGGNLVFIPETNKYDAEMYITFTPDYVHYLNGAWYAYQEQQKKIDRMLNINRKSLIGD